MRKLINTIDETYARAQEENIGVSKNFIRQSAINGTLPCVKAGNRYLINWDTFMTFLSNPAPVEQPRQDTGGIRRIGA